MDLTRVEISDGVVRVLREMSAHEDAGLTDATELYYDLGLAGDDLHNLITEIVRQFGADFTSMKLARHAPG
jgi:hypothetical protein